MSGAGLAGGGLRPGDHHHALSRTQNYVLPRGEKTSPSSPLGDNPRGGLKGDTLGLPPSVHSISYQSSSGVEGPEGQPMAANGGRLVIAPLRHPAWGPGGLIIVRGGEGAWWSRPWGGLDGDSSGVRAYRPGRRNIFSADAQRYARGHSAANPPMALPNAAFGGSAVWVVAAASCTLTDDARPEGGHSG